MLFKAVQASMDWFGEISKSFFHPPRQIKIFVENCRKKSTRAFLMQVSDAETVGSIKSRLGFAGKRTWLKKDNKTVELHDSLTFSTSGIVAFCTLTFFGNSQVSCVSARAVNVKVAPPTFKGALHAKHAQIEEEKANAMREIEKTNAMQDVVDEVFLTHI